MPVEHERIFVLRKTKIIQNFFRRPESSQKYDSHSQIWRWRDNGIPIVLEQRPSPFRSNFGETTHTATREGTDQPENSVSNFGETVITKSQEGTDQSGSTRSFLSNYGESSITETGEGIDQAEGMYSAISSYGETSITRTVEGADQSEGSVHNKIND